MALFTSRFKEVADLLQLPVQEIHRSGVLFPADRQVDDERDRVAGRRNQDSRFCVRKVLFLQVDLMCRKWADLVR